MVRNKVSTKSLKYFGNHNFWCYLMEMRCIALHTITKHVLSALQCYLICTHSQFQSWSLPFGGGIGSGSTNREIGIYTLRQTQLQFGHALLNDLAVTKSLTGRVLPLTFKCRRRNMTHKQALYLTFASVNAHLDVYAEQLTFYHYLFSNCELK